MIIFVAAQKYLQVMNKLVVNMKETLFTVECSATKDTPAN